MDLNDFEAIGEDIERERQRSLKGTGQKIREAELGRTRNILLFIGILSLALNGYMFANSRAEVAKLGLVPVHSERVLILVRIIYGIGLALGSFFTVAGILVKKYPVPLTILSLILYVGSIAGFAMLQPSSLLSGLLIKIIIVISLCDAVKNARSYQNAQQDEPDDE